MPTQLQVCCWPPTAYRCALITMIMYSSINTHGVSASLPRPGVSERRLYAHFQGSTWCCRTVIHTVLAVQHLINQVASTPESRCARMGYSMRFLTQAGDQQQAPARESLMSKYSKDSCSALARPTHHPTLSNGDFISAVDSSRPYTTRMIIEAQSNRLLAVYPTLLIMLDNQPYVLREALQ